MFCTTSLIPVSGTKVEQRRHWWRNATGQSSATLDKSWVLRLSASTTISTIPDITNPWQWHQGEAEETLMKEYHWWILCSSRQIIWVVMSLSASTIQDQLIRTTSLINGSGNEEEKRRHWWRNTNIYVLCNYHHTSDQSLRQLITISKVTLCSGTKDQQRRPWWRNTNSQSSAALAISYDYFKQ